MIESFAFYLLDIHLFSLACFVILKCFSCETFKLTAFHRYMLWKIFFLGIVISVSFDLIKIIDIFSSDIMPLYSIDLSQSVNSTNSRSVQNFSQFNSFESNKHSYTNADKLNAFMTIYLLIALLIFFCILTINLYYYKRIKVWRKPTPESIVVRCNNVSMELGLSRVPCIFLNQAIHSSCITGLFSQRIELPEDYADTNYLALTLKHELLHYKRKDMYWRVMSIVVVSLLWINPFVFWAFLNLRHECELSCDELVTQNMSNQKRLEYANMLIDLIQVRSTTKLFDLSKLSISGGFEEMNKRIENIIRPRSSKKNHNMLSLCSPLLILFIIANVFAVDTQASATTSSPPTVSVESSKEGVTIKPDSDSRSRNASKDDDVELVNDVYIIPVSATSYSYHEYLPEIVMFDIPVGTTVESVTTGVVKNIQDNYTGLGRCVIVENQYGQQFYLGNLSEIHVELGDSVNAGDIIGISGNSGNAKLSGQLSMLILDSDQTAITSQFVDKLSK